MYTTERAVLTKALIYDLKALDELFKIIIDNFQQGNEKISTVDVLL